ncbi:MAG: transglycosylase domain-containing protein [Cyanobium sp. MAG06]|nr:transglycosylase domain-containing protein [Cyanobium sp. MAG06]
MSVEDHDFYNHYGVAPISILRAFVANLMAGKYVQGGSTINQQIIKNSLLSTEKSIERKIKELLLAVKLDKELDKEQILNIYLNDSPYGGSIYGVEEASLAYFNKHASETNINEAAYIAAIPKSPTRLSPFGNNIKELENRKNLVLDLMYKNGYITENDLIENKNKTVTFVKNDFSTGKAHHFVFMVKKYLEDKYGEDSIDSLGFKVITTLDYKLQKQNEDIIKKEFEQYIKVKDNRNVSFIMADPKTGQILSLIGSRNYFDKDIDGQYNTVISKRNPGSSFKPFIYLEGFIKGLTPESIIFDAPTEFSTSCSFNKESCYSPQNYTGKNYGPVSARTSLQNSLNIPSVKMLYMAGLKDVLELAVKVGIDSYAKNINPGLSLALGGSSVSLYEMLQGYSVLANNGARNNLHFILEVRDNKNNIIEKELIDTTQVVPEKYTSVLSNVLSDNNSRNIIYPVNNSMYFDNRPVAAKTGTTQDYRDAWIFGYTPSVVSGL